MKKTTQNIAQNKKKPKSLGWLRCAMIIALMMAWMMPAMAQTGTNRSGIFYFANGGSGKTNPNDPLIANIDEADYFYLVPADNPRQNNKRDAWFSSNYSTDDGDPEKPYLTTYKTKKDVAEVPSGVTNRPHNSVWIVEFASTDNGTDYYHLIHAATGKYVVYEPPYPAKNNRKSVHLLTTDSPGENAEFAITVHSDNYNFRPKSIGTGANINKYLNPSNRNFNYYYSHSNVSDGGVVDYYEGLIGLWKDPGSASDWKPEATLLDAPEITSVDVLTNTITVADVNGLPSGYAIRYTVSTDGNDPADPTATSTEMINGEYHITESCILKAVVERYGMVLTSVATLTLDPESFDVLTFEITCDDKLQIDCNVGAATIYYNYTTNGDDPSDPDNTSTEYIAPVSLDDNAKVKAIAYIGGQGTGISTYTVKHNTAAPTVTLNETTADVYFGSGVTIHYTTNGSDPDPDDVGESTSPFTITGLSSSADVEIRIVATSDGRGNSCPVTVVKRPKKPTINATSYCADNVRYHELTFTPTEEGKTYWYALSNGSGQSAPDLNTFTQYTPGSVVDIAAISTWDGTTVTVTLHAYAKDAEDNPSVVVSQDYTLICTAPPVISHSGATVTIDGTGTIKYKVDGGAEQTYSSPFNITGAGNHVVTATAQDGSEGVSCEVSHVVRIATTITTLSDLKSMNLNGAYDLGADIINDGTYTSIGTDANPFVGSLNGNGHVIKGLTQPLFGVTGTGAEIYNVMLDNVNISSGTNVGAICNKATGNSRIYNCGVLATNSTVTTDEDGYTKITSCSSTISGTDTVGGIVGLLDGTSRVINCFSYANVSGGTHVGGIVGYNNVKTTANNLKTMVMNCMFYGEVSGTSIAPIYNGEIISNVGDKGVSNFNYFRLESAYIQDTSITKVYNCALGAEDRFLQRFEFYRHLLNSHRELAGWWATGTYSSSEMMKWVMIPDSIGTTTPYPILKTPAKYPSVVNIDAEHATTQSERNKGGKLGTLTVNIQMGDGAVYTRPSGAAITTQQLTLNITDKDTTHFNFNYYKVQLPYYNDVGTKNYNGNRVVTGWKIVSITGGTAGSYSTGEDVTYTDGVLTATPYNFADRNCTDKDLYSVTGRVFNQGAYWDVPYGVTAITIEPYWAKCVYLADAYADVVYNQAMGTAYNVPGVGGGQKYTNRNSYTIAGESQMVFTSKGDAIATSNYGLFVGASGSSDHTVYDYAVVLVGNYHFYGNLDADKSKPYTVTSIDLDGDNEPDYSYILRFDSRKAVHPVRVDFINIPGLGMAQKSTGGTGTYNFGIMQPLSWFESTNTSLFRVTQFEYDNNNRIAAPYILQGGVMEQWVNGQSNGHANKTTYFHVGGNVWFKEFHRGTHQDQQYDANHSPVSVTGGDFDQFHLTGLYRADVTIRDDNAECYITGGRFGLVAGTGMDGIGHPTNHTNGNITWIIDNADIKEFYAGSFNADKPAQGNLHTIVNGGHIDFFCGGPKFGDMNPGRTVTTTATGCTFGTFFGAGYGGNSYSRKAPDNRNNVMNLPGRGKDLHNNPQDFNSWNDWLGEEYTKSYESAYGGVSTQFNYQFLPMSSNIDNVARIFVEYVKFSLATTHSVTSSLKHCTIENNFYGGGSLGKVDGTVTSVLDSCTVFGNVFGAGFSASLPTVEVDSIGFRTEPYYYEALGTYLTGVKGQTTTYHWEQGDAISVDNDNYILYITENLDLLGSVSGNVTLTLKGNTTVGTLEGGNLKAGTGNVFGGGDESRVTQQTSSGNPVPNTGNTTVILQQGATVHGNVYGGGNEGPVGGNSEVIIQDPENP